jgi:Rieske 2Fe-2S family protein
MDHSRSFHPASPLLGSCVPSLPALSYYDPGCFAEELKTIWGRAWIYAGRANNLPAMTLRRLSVAGQNLILIKDQDGAISCFHNTCRHRGAELCSAQEKRLESRLITCPYHQWTYALSGELAGTALMTPTADFKKPEHSLFAVHVREWNGFLFVCLADEPPDFASTPDLGLAVYDNWPMRELVTGHTMVRELKCNWKIFWENYNECLHCPSIHPGLCDMVPVYRKGIMSYDEASDWTPEAPRPTRNLKPGARTWTVNGQVCGAEFPLLTDAERAAGYHFVTLLPSLFVVAHVDYVRAVSLRPLGPETTELRAEWLFPRTTLEAPGFDLSNVVDFAAKIILEDGEACELNQRGVRCSRFSSGTLVPQEYAIFQFHEWVRTVTKEVRS